jgi:amino acid transporter
LPSARVHGKQQHVRRGGVYVVVRDAMGRLSHGSRYLRFLFDYILTGPISAVSAGQYLGRLLNDASDHFAGGSLHAPPNLFAVVFAVSVTVYFWWCNIKGPAESSHKALQIMKIMTFMIATFLVWSAVTLIVRGGPAQMPPLRCHPIWIQQRRFGMVCQGVLVEDASSVASIALMIAIGHFAACR